MYLCKHRHLASSEPCEICHAEQQAQRQALAEARQSLSVIRRKYEEEIQRLRLNNEELEDRLLKVARLLIEEYSSSDVEEVCLQIENRLGFSDFFKKAEAVMRQQEIDRHKRRIKELEEEDGDQSR